MKQQDLKKETRALTATASTANPAWTYLVNAWIFIPALLYFAVVSQHAVNIPIMDDYDTILQFIHDFNNASFGQKMALLFSQHNEHRLLHSRIIYTLYYLLFHHINFRHLIFIADLQLLVIFLVSVHFIKKSAGKYWNFIALIWGFCIFDLNTYENGSIAMYGMQNYGIVMLFMLSLYFYSKDKLSSLIAAALIQAVCIFSAGNGLIGSLFLAAFTFFDNNKQKKIAAIAITVICGALYFVNYHNNSGVTDYIRPGIAPDLAIPFFLKMAGADFSFDYALVSGIIILAVLAAVFPYKKLFSNRQLAPVICMLGFVLTSMATIALFRSIIKGWQFQASRYLIYPQLLVAVAASLVFIKLQSKNPKWQLPAVIALLLIVLKAYTGNYQFGKLGFERMQARAEGYDYYFPDKKKAKDMSDQACQDGVYCIQEER